MLPRWKLAKVAVRTIAGRYADEYVGEDPPLLPLRHPPFPKDGTVKGLGRRSFFGGVVSLEGTPNCNDMAFSTGSGVGAGISDPRRTTCSYRNNRVRRTGTIPWSDNP